MRRALAVIGGRRCVAWAVGMCGVVFVAAAAEAQPGPTRIEQVERGTVHLRVYRGELSEGNAAAARRTLEAILGRAGVDARWADCDAGDPGCGVDETSNTLVVRFPAGGEPHSPGACGEIVRAPGVLDGVITVRLRCVRALLHRVHFGHGADGLQRLGEGALVGALVAHEIGHALREPHTARGLMRETLGRVEFQELAAGTLSFTAAQAVRLRQAAVTSAAGLLASRR